MHRLFHKDAHLPCDAGSRKPSGIRHIRVGYLHAYLIVHIPEKGLFADVISKRDVAVGTFSQVIAVAPYLAVFIYSVEQQ